MDKGASNVNNAMEIDIDDDSDQCPLMLLLKRLTKNNQNTVMTNVQIIDILEKEFYIDIESRHELEVDILIKIVKKFLKDWPQWDELERVSSRLKTFKDYAAISKVLKHKYKNLKEYLGVMLEAATPIVKDTIDKLDEKAKKDITEPAKGVERDIVLDIHCTREQLNKLFWQHPVFNGTITSNQIFNTEPEPPNKISCSMLSLGGILNMWCFKIVINLNTICYSRDLSYNYKHVLVNKAGKHHPEPSSTLDEGWMMISKNNSKQVSRKEILRELKDITHSKHMVNRDLLAAVVSILRSDLEAGPEFLKLVKYRKYCNKYKYVRYLCKSQGGIKNDKYDLQLEETVSPMVNYFISHYSKSNPLIITGDWLKFECIVCKMKFTCSRNLKEDLINHYNDNHSHNEPDWTCTHCKMSFNAGFLSDNRWWHEC